MTLTSEDLISQYKRAHWRAWKLTSTPTMMESLAEEADPNIRLGVAWNPVTQERVLNLLRNDEDVRVATAAQSQLDFRARGKQEEKP